MDEPVRYRVLVVDDNTFIRAGLTSALESTDDIEVVGEAGDGREAEELAWRLVPDVVLLDVRMPRADGVSAAAALSRISRVIMLTQVEEPEVILSAVRNGAVGYLVHNTFTVDELAAAIRDTVRHRAHPLSHAASAALIDAARTGRPAAPAADPAEQRARFGLSAREVQVMDLIVRGHANHDIAAKLFLTEKTVKNYINRIYAKLGVPNRATAIVTWLGMPPGG
ncbi:DNA-binding NarL/FixJ family response regulator [Actinomadura luteofluorescens]|uniref:DNA-binding NarL/FixJ family response regulator n=1 Tax=Actinomadura luteofluorescens TaxID=46163 RepID=A0A7Y9JG69_9ACTN|nr:response regulator transcription factor [Actinomadura luteofluorescens]NYD46014.1 DNA-binding NarL/FixJ family response regulator [Actinomadura luteofluorescens]